MWSCNACAAGVSVWVVDDKVTEITLSQLLFLTTIHNFIQILRSNLCYLWLDFCDRELHMKNEAVSKKLYHTDCLSLVAESHLTPERTDLLTARVRGGMGVWLSVSNCYFF